MLRLAATFAAVSAFLAFTALATTFALAFGAFGRRHVSGDELATRKISFRIPYRFDHAPGMPVGRIDDNDIRSGFEQGLHARLTVVQMGALYTVDWDYREVGAACARLAAREAGFADAPLPAPRPRVSVNMKSAAHFGVAWDARLLRTVDVRHE